jgi:hypothetical protein
MRYVILACLLSACSAYPAVQWPQGVGRTPGFLPQTDLQMAPASEAADASLGPRAAGLRAWAMSVTR